MVSEDIIIKQYNEAKEKFSKLQYPQRVKEGWKILGQIDVIDDQKTIWDHFDVKILFPSNYPEELFELSEIGNKIPKGEEWHNSETCCLSTNAVIFSEMLGNLTLLNWLNKFAHPFLANFVYKIKTGCYANEVFEHGVEGLIQGYFRVFRTNDLHRIIERLKYVTGTKKMGRNDPCFCGRDKKYKHCYLIAPQKHSPGIPIKVLKDDLAAIIIYLEKTNQLH
jgi:hypothetical protein